MKYLLVILICAVSFQAFSEKVTKTKAEKIAKNWGSMYLGKSKTDIVKEKSCYFKYDNDTSLHIFNFNDTGFIIVSSDDHTYPVLAYSVDNNIDLSYISPQLNDWLKYYSEMIKFNKKEKQDVRTKNKWEQIESGVISKSVQTTVPSLFESSQSSRWAAWRPYFNQAPTAQSQYYEGYNGCVPLAVSQIMKYFKYPLIGTGTGTGTGWTNGSYFTQNINRFFDYSQMPFRLTYCGNGTNNCNDGSFDIIPGVTLPQIDEVGKILYNAGLAVGMHWIGMGNDSTTTTGTTGNPQDWVLGMANHFYYTSPTSSDYWSESEISGNTTGFKTGLRNSLNNGYPILFKYNQNKGGHAVVIDGYENDEFFHFAVGRGGVEDAYYYLFSSDNDGVHLPRPYINLFGLEACMNIHPDCPPVQNKTVTNKTITNGSGELIQSGNDLLIDHVTVQSGGRAVLRAN